MEYKIKIKMKLEDRTKKVKKCQKLLSHKNKLKLQKKQDAYSQSKARCERLKEINQQNIFKKTKEQQKEMNTFYSENIWKEEDRISKINEIHLKRISDLNHQEQLNSKQ